MTRRDKPPEWSVRCPWCEAAPNVRCLTPKGRLLPNGLQSHDARIQAHTQQTGDDE